MTKNNIDYIEFLSPEEREERKEEIAQDLLRHARIQILKPFDLWEKAVVRGRESDSEMIMAWYYSILDLVPEAFENIPEDVSKYE